MGEQTGIEFTDHTLNPWHGCSKVKGHKGCANCYAERDSMRFNKGMWGPNGFRKMIASFRGNALKFNRKAKEQGIRRRVMLSFCDPFEDFSGPVVGSDGRSLFNLTCCSEPDVSIGCRCPDSAKRAYTLGDARRRVLFPTIDETPWLDWLIFTKRPQNIRRMWPVVNHRWDKDGERCMNCGEKDWIAGDCCGQTRNNVWLITSVSEQKDADKMIPILMNCHDLSPVLGVSYEPARGPVDLSPWIPSTDGFVSPFLDGPIHIDDLPPHLDWIVAGGESGSNATPPHPEWFRHIRDLCLQGDIPFFLKQWGEYGSTCVDLNGELSDHFQFTSKRHWVNSASTRIQAGDFCQDLSGKRLVIGKDFDDAQYPVVVHRKVGKKKSGRLLDGVEHNGLPDRPEVKNAYP